MSLLNESIVEDAALTWFGELVYTIGHGPHMAPGEPVAERNTFGDVVLTGRLRETILRLNRAIPSCALTTLRNAKQLKLRSGKLPTSFILSA